jgi:hypothetical protein
MDKDTQTAERLVDRHAPGLMAIDGVESVGVGEHQGKPCILITVSDPQPEVKARLPKQLDGVPVRIELGGQAEAY